jgi:hypothetical protein
VDQHRKPQLSLVVGTGGADVMGAKTGTHSGAALGGGDAPRVKGCYEY